MSAISPYIYTRLDKEKQEIRLLTLLPSQSLDEPIRITIAHVPFIVNEKDTPSRPDLEDSLSPREKRWVGAWKCPNDERGLVPYFNDAQNETHEPLFEALSYTWGSSTKSERVYILNEASVTSDDITTEATPCLQLDITEHLANALRHLRYADRTRILWVDAISINQGDVTDRSEQVLRMKDLYKHVDRVLVWLGTSSEDSSLALSTLEYIGQQVEISLDMISIRAPGAIEDSWNFSDHSLYFDDEIWESIYKLITRSWFDRLWITQEIHLANPQAIVQCGNQNVLWCLLRRGILCLQNKTHGVPKHVSERLRSIVHLFYLCLGMHLPDLLQRYHHRECADLLDRVYGLLGLAPSSSTQYIKPDYFLTTLDAYKSVFLGYTSQSRRLDLLDVANSNDPLPIWPSWVPDWSIFLEAAGTVALGFCARVDSSACWNNLLPGILEVVGVQISTISHLLVVAEWISDLLPDNELENQNLQYPTGENILDVYARVRHQNFILETVHLNHSTKGSLITLPDARRLMLENSSNSTKNTWTTTMLEGTSDLWIIRTSEGYVGMAPRDCKTNDIICVILGTNVPIVLRKSTIDSTYKVIGHLYIHGWMYGEALLGPLPEPWEARKEGGLGGKWLPRFYNRDTKELVDFRGDPRLGPIPDNWEQLENDDPHRLQKWKNVATGEIINSDPRLLPSALVERGVESQTFALA